MEISPLRMALLLLYSFCFGMLMGAFYDVNRIIRVFFGVRYSKAKFERIGSLRLPFVKKSISLRDKGNGIVQGVVVFLGDAFCLICAAVGVIILNYGYNNGIFRSFTVIGTFLGFLLYYFSLGRLIILISEPLAMLTKYVFLSIFIIFGYPFYIIGKKVAKLVAKTVFLCSFTLEKRQEKVYNIKEEVYLLEMSKNGFINR